MEWPMFSEHIVHNVEKWRNEKYDAEKQNKQLANKLTQLQLGELSKQKKEKEKAENEIMMITTAQAQTPPKSAMVLEAPVAPQIQNQIQSSSGTGQITPVTPSVAPLPPIHMHVNTTGGNYRTM